MGLLGRWWDRLDERRAARAYERRMNAARDEWYASDRFAQIKACKHLSRRPNPDSVPREGWGPGEICNDCGTGITTFLRRS